MSNAAQTPMAAANRLIERLLASMLESVPGASRICLTGFGAENGETLPAEICLPPINVGQCLLHRASDFQAATIGDCLLPLGAAGAALVCPAADLSGDRVGAVCIVWDGNDRPPEPKELIALLALGVRVGGQVAEVLDLCRYTVGSAGR